MASARLTDLAVSDFGGAPIITSVESFADNDTTLMTSAAIDDRIGSFGYTTNVGDNPRVNTPAGDGLTGNSKTQSVVRTLQTINVGAGSYIIANADDIVPDAQQFQQQVKLLLETVQVMLPQTILLVQPSGLHMLTWQRIIWQTAIMLPGTVVEFGGSAEVTASSRESSPAVAGVVSTDPAHLMNADLEGDNVVAVALRGRVSW